MTPPTTRYRAEDVLYDMIQNLRCETDASKVVGFPFTIDEYREDPSTIQRRSPVVLT